MKPLNANINNGCDAVGVSKSWYIAIVNNNTERRCSEKLTKLGLETYVPIQSELVQQKSKKKVVDKIIFSSFVFLKASERERLEVVKLPFIHRFMTDRAGGLDKYNRHPIAIVPEKQINQLKFMLYNSEEPVEFIDRVYRIGERIRIARGSLCGLEGNILQQDEEDSFIVVGLDILGFAKVKVDYTDIELVS